MLDFIIISVWTYSPSHIGRKEKTKACWDGSLNLHQWEESGEREKEGEKWGHTYSQVKNAQGGCYKGMAKWFWYSYSKVWKSVTVTTGRSHQEIQSLSFLYIYVYNYHIVKKIMMRRHLKIFIFILFIWLCQVSVVACGIFHMRHENC